MEQSYTGRAEKDKELIRMLEQSRIEANSGKKWDGGKHNRARF